MLEIAEDGTISDLLADASASGYSATARLVRDWTEQGLLDYPRKRPAGKGHGSAPALYPASQRNLFLTLLHHRPGNHIPSLARIPVGIWMYWGETYVPLRQARRALATWIGDPRASKQRARETARAILGQLDNPRATASARRELLDVLTDTGYTGRADFPRIEAAIRAVFEPGHERTVRAVGHPAAPVMTDSVIGVMRARLAAAAAVTAGDLTDETLTQARDSHLFAYAEYAARQPFLTTAAPPGQPQLYAPVTGQDTLNNSCGHLLSAIGLELIYPEDGERLRRARAGAQRPAPATFGLTAAQLEDARRPGEDA